MQGVDSDFLWPWPGRGVARDSLAVTPGGSHCTSTSDWAVTVMAGRRPGAGPFQNRDGRDRERTDIMIPS